MSSHDIILNNVFVTTNTDTELTPVEWAQKATVEIIRIGDTTPEPLRAQAHAFRDKMAGVIANYINAAILADRVHRS